MHGHHEVFARFTLNREWDVSELSFAKFAAQQSLTTDQCYRFSQSVPPDSAWEYGGNAAVSDRPA